MMTTEVARHCVLRRALTAMDAWSVWSTNDQYAPEAAWDLLGCIGALQRIYSQEDWPLDAHALQELASQEKHDLLDAAFRGVGPAEWRDRAEDAREGSEFMDESSVHELDLAVVNLFHDLDRNSLAVVVAKQWTDQSANCSEQLADWSRQVESDEGWFRDHLDLFLTVLPVATATLVACRHDLDEEPDLWATILKHRALEEFSEELHA